MYGRIPGAQYVNRSDVGAIWELPCDKEVNMTFIFGGQKIPIHPLDSSLDLNLTDTAGNRVCLGSVSTYGLPLLLQLIVAQFQPITTSTGGNYDAILGMGFRVYSPLPSTPHFAHSFHSSKRLHPHRLRRLRPRHFQHRQPLHSAPSHNRTRRGPPRFCEHSLGRKR